MLYLKALMHKISYRKQVVFLIVFIMFAIGEKVYNNIGFFDIIKAILPVLCIGLAVMYLQIYKKNLGAHGLILLSLFAKYLFNTFTSLLSLEFKSFSLITPVDGFDAIGAVVAIYLILFVISLWMNEKEFKFNINFMPLILLTGFYLASRYSLEYLFFHLIIMFFVSAFQLKNATYLYLISYLITTPFMLMDLVIDKVGINILTYWVYTIYGFVLLIVFTIGLIKSLRVEEA